MLEGLGDCYFKRKDKDVAKALTFYKKAEKAKETVLILIKEGKCLEKQKEFFQAFECYKKAVKLD